VGFDARTSIDRAAGVDGYARLTAANAAVLVTLRRICRWLAVSGQ
jgi:hypothetical protein